MKHTHPGRPRIGPQVKIAIGDELLAAIDEAAAADGVSRAEWIRRACMQSLPSPGAGVRRRPE